MPLVEEVVLYAVIERVCRIIGAMVKAGVPLPEAMQAAIQGANNKVFEERPRRRRASDARRRGPRGADRRHRTVPARPRSR